MANNVGIPKSLAELGVKEEDFSVLADNALKDVCGLTNPIQATKEEIIQIFRNAY
jgi:alcohol dehydrogenase